MKKENGAHVLTLLREEEKTRAFVNICCAKRTGKIPKRPPMEVGNRYRVHEAQEQETFTVPFNIF